MAFFTVVMIKSTTNKIVKKEKDLDARTQKIAEQQALLEVRVRSYYIRSFLNSPLAIIFSQGDAGGIMRELSYRMATAREDQKVITSITEEITDLLVQKEKLEKDKVSLAGLQVEVDKNAGFLGGEIKKAKDAEPDELNYWEMPRGALLNELDKRGVEVKTAKGVYVTKEHLITLLENDDNTK